jgi:hypothetical protein
VGEIRGSQQALVGSGTASMVSAITSVSLQNDITDISGNRELGVDFNQ